MSGVSGARAMPIKAMARAYAAKAAPAPAVATADLKVSTLENGLRVATCDTPTPGLAYVGLYVRAGSRYENYNTMGAAQAMKVAAGLATKGQSALSLTRNLQQLGSSLECKQGREIISYGATFTQDQVANGVDFLLDAATNPAFKPWEVEGTEARLRAIVSGLSQCDVAVEALHKAAFRDGLGNSIYAPEFLIGKHKAPLLQAYFNATFTSSRAALVGVGVDQSLLAKLASTAALAPGAGDASKSKYHGGEVRLERGGKTASIVIAGAGAGSSNLQEFLAGWALSHVLGRQSRIKRAGPGGKLGKALEAVPDGGVRAANGVAFGYSDAGLVGVQLFVDASAAGKAVSSVGAALRSLSISDADLAGAKKAMLAEDGDLGAAAVAGLLGESLVTMGEAVAVDQIPALVEKVSLGEVQAVAKKAFGGKLSMSAVGNLSTVPYLDAI